MTEQIIPCSACSGTGWTPYQQRCGTCQGRRMVAIDVPIDQDHWACNHFDEEAGDEFSAEQSYKNMFGAAIAALAEISEALGIDEEAAACANGNELILAAIRMKDLALKSRPKGGA